MENEVFTTENGAEVKWKIPRFLQLPHRKGDALTSSEFSVGFSTWCINIFPRGDDFSKFEDISMYLTLVEGAVGREISWKLKMEADESVLHEAESKFFCADESYSWYNSINRRRVFDTLSNASTDIVTVNFMVRFKKDPPFERTVNLAPPKAVDITSHVRDLTTAVSKTKGGFENLSHDLETLFLDENFSDVKVKVQGKEFSAHKFVLGSRSPVFLAMFQHQMAESNSGILEINDMDPKLFPDFLRFLYSGKYDCITPENVAELYEAADKYDLKDFKEECARRMKENLSLEIILDVILFANNYEDKDLLDSATEFFAENAETIRKSNEWKSFCLEEGNFKLIEKLMLEVSKNG